MKKLFLSMACIISCFAISCNQPASTATTDTVKGTDSTSSQAEKNRAGTMAVYKAFETGDMSGLDSFIDKDVVDHNAGPDGEIRGLDSLKKMFTRMHDNISDLKIESIANATDGDYDFDLNHMTGTTKTAYMGMPANTKIDMMSVDVVKIKDGKAVEHWGYMDPNEMTKMMQMQKMPSTDKKMDTSKMHK
jgi:predicted SnoaL-like aldol condensation-catalyzing enzyme